MQVGEDGSVIAAEYEWIKIDAEGQITPDGKRKLYVSFHEKTHFLQHDLPRWFAEGMAMFTELVIGRELFPDQAEEDYRKYNSEYKSQESSINIRSWQKVRQDLKVALDDEKPYYGASMQFFLDLADTFGLATVTEINKKVMKKKLTTTGSIVKEIRSIAGKKAVDIFNIYCRQ